jgi:inner membrane protein
MDPLTHALAGAAVSYALFGRRLGRHAAALGALAGIAPDIDHFVSSEADPLLYVEYHRFFTHSLAFSVIGSLICALPWIWRKRFRRDWKRLWICALPAYISHCLLDTATTYGTQLFWPFTNQRLGWDLIAVVDPLFTVVIGITLWIGIAKRNRTTVIAGVAFASAYLTLGGIQKTRALNVQARLAATRDHVIQRSEVMPTIGNNLVWRSLYLSDGNIHSDRIRAGWFSSATFREGTSLPLTTKEMLTSTESDGNQATRAFERFSWFSDGWVARSPFDESVIGDMRYSISTKAFDPIWGIRFVREGDRVAMQWINRQLERKASVTELWSEIVAKHPDYKEVAD